MFEIFCPKYVFIFLLDKVECTLLKVGGNLILRSTKEFKIDRIKGTLSYNVCIFVISYFLLSCEDE